MVRGRSHRIFSESVGVTTSNGEEEGQADEVGHRPERAEQGDIQGQLPHQEYTVDLTQSARCYSVFVSGCLWSL